MDLTPEEQEYTRLAGEFCKSKGMGWIAGELLGSGGTAAAVLINTPDGERALKIFSAKYSSGEKGAETGERINLQMKLRDHNCPYLVKCLETGVFEERRYLLMNRAPGKELAKILGEVPREAIPIIIEQVARAASHLETIGLCHRDIKSANIFISDDFSQSTLLDTSVLRDVNDPIGSGTDHGNQLPVVATSRYSPPEYLFRLLLPGTQLWHAVNVYQLGGVLHDLIMRYPLFEKEYQEAQDSRYRFAWTVATVNPPIEASDVPQHLITLCRRALDKSWERRSSIKLIDFTTAREAQRAQAKVFLGFDKLDSEERNSGLRMLRLTGLARELEEQVTAYLRNEGILANHSTALGSKLESKVIAIAWKHETELTKTEFKLSIEVGLDQEHNKPAFNIVVRLQDDARERELELRQYNDSDAERASLISDVCSSVLELGALLSA